jgi:hypothetical protein
MVDIWCLRFWHDDEKALQELAMLELITDLPDNVLGLTAKGEVTAEDYRAVLVPAVEDKLARYSRLRLLYVIGDDFERFSGGAAWEDAKVGMRHFTSFERVAVVTDADWIRGMVRAFGFALPGDVRVYDGDDAGEARSWVSAPPSAGRLEFELLRDEGVLVLEPKGELESADFERVAREIDPYIESAGGLAGLVVVAREFPGWDDFAALTSHFRFVREHHRKVRRVALVTTSRFLSAVPGIASRFVSAEVKKFSMDEQDAAMRWAAGQS